MTATADTGFVADLDLIGHLDFTPPCGLRDCDHEAAWLVIYRTECCASREEILFCEEHKTRWLQHISNPGKPGCSGCGFEGRTGSTVAEYIVIDRIEPIRPGAS